MEPRQADQDPDGCYFPHNDQVAANDPAYYMATFSTK